ncbi:MAG: hypothetical protein GY922_19140 [Proteobacteria bacterium]|nr:hypothetical protein [Pseudomonadota bacterium]
MTIPEQRHFGYLHGEEDFDFLSEQLDPEGILERVKASYPEFNPYATPWLNWQDQGNQGSCQGHSLSHAFQVCLVQEYGLQAVFSRAAAYYISQDFDGIKGDRGSTLSGGQKAAASGICLEKEWPYPYRYNSTKPASANGNLNIKMPGSKRVTDAGLAFDLLNAGCCISTGVAWNSDFEKPVCDKYRNRRGGGHSTLLYGIDESTGHAIHWNSWKNWQNNGRNLWTKRFLDSIMKLDRYAVFVCYDSTKLQVPDDLGERI